MSSDYLKYSQLVLDEIKTAIDSINSEQVESLCEEILKADAVFLIGVGRVLTSLQAFAKRLNHLGIKAWCVGQVNEPAITKDDLLIVGSGSGESKVPLAITEIAKGFNARIIHIGSNQDSSISKYTDLLIRIPVRTRLHLPDEIESDQIMTSLFEQSLFILGDIVALMIADRKNITNIEDLWRFHANLE